MKYNVEVINNEEHNTTFNKYSDALDYCEVIGRVFCIPISLFLINTKNIEFYKIQNKYLRGNIRGI